MIASICLSMISAQTRSAFVARENRFPLFRIMLAYLRFRACWPRPIFLASCERATA